MSTTGPPRWLSFNPFDALSIPPRPDYDSDEIEAAFGARHAAQAGWPTAADAKTARDFLQADIQHAYAVYQRWLWRHNSPSNKPRVPFAIDGFKVCRECSLAAPDILFPAHLHTHGQRPTLVSKMRCWGTRTRDRSTPRAPGASRSKALLEMSRPSLHSLQRRARRGTPQVPLLSEPLVRNNTLCISPLHPNPSYRALLRMSELRVGSRPPIPMPFFMGMPVLPAAYCREGFPRASKATPMAAVRRLPRQRLEGTVSTPTRRTSFGILPSMRTSDRRIFFRRTLHS